MLAALPLFPALPLEVSAEPVLGSGTENDPYILLNAADWVAFAADVNAGVNTNKHYKLADTFDNAASPVTDTVGTQSHPFTGTFDGNGRTLTVAIDSNDSYTAPFRYIDNATIKDLTVAGSVNGYVYASGLAGDVDANSTIQNCTVETVVSAFMNLGGVIGQAHNGTLCIRNTVFTGTLAANADSKRAAGLAPWCYSETLDIDGFLYAGKCDTSLVKAFHPLTINKSDDSVDAVLQNVYYFAPPKISSSYNVTEGGTRMYSPDEYIIRPLRNVLGFVCGDESDCAAIDLPSEFNYTGEVIDIDSYVPHLPDGTELEKNVDYIVSVTPSTVLEAGEYTVTYAGIGAYCGTQSLRFFVIKGTAALTSGDTVWKDGYTYVVNRNVSISDRISVEGNVHLYLCAGKTLTASMGIDVPEGSSLTIDADDNTGKLTAKMNKDTSNKSAIGSHGTKNCGNITINGGTVTAVGAKKKRCDRLL